MIEDDFYATIKLKCGDEIFCKVHLKKMIEQCYLYLILSVFNPLRQEDQLLDTSLNHGQRLQ